MNNIHDFRAKRLIRNLLDFIYPPLCQICKTNFDSEDDNIWICPSCYRRISILPQPHCPICRSAIAEPDQNCRNCRQSTSIAWVYSLGYYDESFSHLIKAFKYEGRGELGKMLGNMLGEQLAQLPHSRSVDLVCAIPVDRKKESKRGFNQTEILAAEIAKCINAVYEPELLVLSRKVRDQIGLTVRERYQNVRGAFTVSEPALVAGKRVLVVDDVTTSGATLVSAGTCLKEAAARSVAAATIAMALEDGLEPQSLHVVIGEEF